MKIGKYEIKVRSVGGISVYYLEDTEIQCSSLHEYSFMTDAILSIFNKSFIGKKYNFSVDNCKSPFKYMGEMHGDL